MREAERVKKYILIIVATALMLVGCNNNSEAKDIAESYMDSVRNGEDFELIITSEYKFIDVFEYDYLRTLDEVRREDSLEFSREVYDLFRELGEYEEHPTYEDHKEAMKVEFHDHEILEDDNDTLILWNRDGWVEDHTLLYDVVVADEEGNKIYKKAEIIVSFLEGEDRQSEFIRSIKLR
ncbi:hypothetical protein BCBBV1cgp2 [Bacillus phage BCASJ1c]|uniref:2 protein n=1 Tax=Bacillus phage BCASJ1c TaxID=294382 RepID=Q5YAA7_9CAUD|nr:hypothetical protein BCBBV1cgp2 [Bacillus phage BCASJ1c]AAU85050.1 2 [Bacillus phage BCASJ1c] [Bacillus phage BCASJ1c]